MKILKIIGKSFLWFITGIFSLILLIFISLNILKYAIYSEYYSIKTNICENPGLNDGFVCQGIAANEENGVILVSGYMNNKTNSRIYITDYKNNSYYVKLTKNGNPYTGHIGGIATTNNNVYICGNSGFYILKLDELLNLKNENEIALEEYVEVEGAASFVFSNEEYLLIGEFHNGKEYVTNHPYETKDGTYYAIIRQYSINDFSKPVKVYSIRNKVQGACLTPEGKIVLSTSYGLASTEYFIYDSNNATKSANYLDDAPVYYLDNYEKKITGPAMGEDLDYYDGGVITLTESASNKYIFGKLFFATKIVKLAF